MFMSQNISISQDVQKAYIAYYGRAADIPGGRYWTGRLEDANGDMSEIIDAFGNSDEFNQVYGNMNNSQLIENLYMQLLNRTPDQVGKSWYVNLLETGASSLQQISLDIMNGVSGDDITTVNQKIDVANYITANVPESLALEMEPWEWDAFDNYYTSPTAVYEQSIDVIINGLYSAHPNIQEPEAPITEGTLDDYEIITINPDGDYPQEVYAVDLLNDSAVIDELTHYAERPDTTQESVITEFILGEAVEEFSSYAVSSLLRLGQYASTAVGLAIDVMGEIDTVGGSGVSHCALNVQYLGGDVENSVLGNPLIHEGYPIGLSATYITGDPFNSYDTLHEIKVYRRDTYEGYNKTLVNTLTIFPDDDRELPITDEIITFSNVFTFSEPGTYDLNPNNGAGVTVYVGESPESVDSYWDYGTYTLTGFDVFYDDGKEISSDDMESLSGTMVVTPDGFTQELVINGSGIFVENDIISFVDEDTMFTRSGDYEYNIDFEYNNGILTTITDANQINGNYVEHDYWQFVG